MQCSSTISTSVHLYIITFTTEPMVLSCHVCCQQTVLSKMWSSNANSSSSSGINTDTSTSNSDYTAVHVVMLIVFYKALRDATLNGELRPISIALRYVFTGYYVYYYVETVLLLLLLFLHAYVTPLD
jgi:hypothetical protein